MIDERTRIYEQPLLRGAAGGPIRPGGLGLTDRALEMCGLEAGAFVLDVGCGAAATADHLTRRHRLKAVGIDPSTVLLGSGRERNAAIPLIRASGERLPFAGGTLDAILAECSLSAMADAGSALAEFQRALRPGGWLILSDIYARDPDGVDVLRQLPAISCLCGAVTQTESVGRVEAHGFTVRQWEDHTNALNTFAAQMIWAGGSLQQLWSGPADQADTCDLQAAIARSRPGYYLLIGHKE